MKNTVFIISLAFCLLGGLPVLAEHWVQFDNYYGTFEVNTDSITISSDGNYYFNVRGLQDFEDEYEYFAYAVDCKTKTIFIKTEVTDSYIITNPEVEYRNNLIKTVCPH